jgi:hypothetical protein
MKTTDTLQFVFDQAGLFCSTDGDDFKPKLPVDHRFEKGHTWPNKEEHPNGAAPTGDHDAQYGFEPGKGGSCDDIRDLPMQPIKVTSSRP